MKRHVKLTTFSLLLILCALVLLVAGSTAAGLYGDDQPLPDPTPDAADSPWGPLVGPEPSMKTIPLKPLAIDESDAAANATIASDDFNSCELNTEIWEFINPPPADSTSDMVGTFTDDAWLRFDLPGGGTHNPWLEGNMAPRVMQSVSDPQSFEVEVKFESALSKKWQMQGIIVEEAWDSFMRFDFHSDGDFTYVYWVILGPAPAGSIDPLKVVKVPIRRDIAPAKKAPLYMRVSRQGDTFSMRYSFDRSAWSEPVTWDYPMTVTKLGVFAANAGDSPPSARIEVDYFFNTASPIDPEDDARNTLTVGVEPAGKGTVTKVPDKGTGSYDCNEAVQLTAAGQPFWGFVEWTGDLTGTENPTTIQMNGSRSISATFASSQWTLTLATEGQGVVAKNPDLPSYAPGSVVTLTTIPSAGWAFQEWQGDSAGDLVRTGSNTWQLTMDANKSLKAVFAQNRIYVPLAVQSY